MGVNLGLQGAELCLKRTFPQSQLIDGILPQLCHHLNVGNFQSINLLVPGGGDSVVEGFQCGGVTEQQSLGGGFAHLLGQAADGAGEAQGQQGDEYQGWQCNQKPPLQRGFYNCLLPLDGNGIIL